MGRTISPSGITVTLVTVSDRSHLGEREDLSGPAAARDLEDAGFRVIGNPVIPDGRDGVKAALMAAIENSSDVVLTLGGTGAGPRDETPDGTLPLIERELPGIADGLRAAGAESVPTAVLSRGVAGLSYATHDGHRSVLVNLPGSTGGVRDGVQYLTAILPHLVDQVKGGDH